MQPLPPVLKPGPRARGAPAPGRVNLFIPKALRARVDLYATAHGITLSEAFRRLVLMGLSLATPDPE